MIHRRITAGAAVFLFLIFTLFSCKSYPPAFNVEQFYNEYNTNVDFIDAEDYLVVMPKNEQPGYFPENGIIFYPGGLVEYHAYLPLLTLCAQNGTACFIVKMPLDFAFMDRRAAGKFPKLHPEIKKWYMAGHSLGGAMAASYISRHAAEFDGLILLAAYSTHDISKTNLKVLSIYGSNDKVLNMEHYQKYYAKLPQTDNGLTEIIIDGGNHAQFASYGAQEGDGTADITASEQQKKTADEITLWMGLK